MSDEMKNNYAKTLQDEELKDGVTYLSTKDTGLSKDIIVDCGETYKVYHHNLCLYVVNGNEVYPVFISTNPTSPLEKVVPVDIISFIKDNLTTLIQFANMEIDGGDFFDAIEKYKNSKNGYMPIEEARRLSHERLSKRYEKIELSEELRKYLDEHKPLIVGDWSACCLGKTFKVNHSGIKLAAREDEDLEKIIFDVEKKTVSVKVKNPTLSTKAPRTLDLSDAADFFEELRKNIETILTTKDGKFKSVIPNDDRTIFEIS